jgi:tRNA acetyltransferase TAN1
MAEKRKAGGGGDDRDGGNKRRRKWDSAKPINGPGIFVSCVRGKERKAADELIEFLDDVVERYYQDVVRAKTTLTQPDGHVTTTASKDESDDIEAQIQVELADLKGQRKAGTKEGKPPSNFTMMLTDMECFFFVSVADIIDPVKVTCALLEEVRRTGKARSRFVHRLSPVQDTVHAETQSIRELAQNVVLSETDLVDAQTPTTFKVDTRMRLHNRIAKMDIIRIVAACMPAHAKAQLKAPDLVVNVEVFRMIVGIAILPKYELYRRYNPLLLAEESQAASSEALGGDQLSRVSLTTNAPAR